MIPTALDDSAGEQESLGFFVDNRWARAALGAGLLLLVVTVVAWNLPRSVLGYEVRDSTQEQLAPLVYRLGMDQGWEVFAPNPSSVSTAVEADVTFADGSVERFRFPDDGPGLGALREYRWRKWETRLRKEKYDHLWAPTADWIAAELSEPDAPVVEVTLIRNWSRMPEPGSGDPRVWESVEFHTENYHGGSES